jgi:hypothetical protein
MANFAKSVNLIGYADSVNATGRIGPSAFSILIDFGQIGLVTGTGAVEDDVITNIGTLPKNCVVRRVAGMVVEPLQILDSDKTPAKLEFIVKGGATALGTLDMVGGNGNKLAVWADPANLAAGTIGVDDTKSALTVTLGDIHHTTNTDTAIVGGKLLLVFMVDYMPEPDEVDALFQDIDEYVSDGGNTAPEVTIGGGY